MSDKASQFLHDRNPQFHAHQQVEGVVDYLRSNGEKIPNQPVDKITHYLGFLADKEYVNDGILTGDQESIDRQITAHVIKAKDVPKAYFDLQKRIAREQGHGDIEIEEDTRKQMIESIQADQQASLNKWVEYLGGEDGSYPNWFKHYAWDSIIKLGDYDKEKHAFQKRSKGTTAIYPDLNREALAYTFNTLNKTRIEEKIEISESDDAKLHELLKSSNFGKLYAHSVESIVHDSPELRNSTEGAWKKFDQTDDPRTARRLSETLAGHGTGWCTAGESTAKEQLEHGDFYVYYSQDAEGKDTIPRVAVRMEYDKVAEVRGIEEEQNLEGSMTDIAMEKVQELPGGESYIKTSKDMKQLTEIDNRVKDGGELTAEDILFLRYAEIDSFGYDEDPRVSELMADRDLFEDLKLLFKTQNPEKVYETIILSQQGPADLVNNLDMLEPGVIDHHKFANFLLTPEKTTYEDKDEEETYFTPLRSDGKLGVELVFKNLEKFEEGSVDFNKLFLKDGQTVTEFYRVARKVLENFEKIPPGAIDQRLFAQAMLRNQEFAQLAENLDKFEPGAIDYDEFADLLFEDKNIRRIDLIESNLDVFLDHVDPIDLATKFIDIGRERVVSHNFDQFLDHVDQKKFATVLMQYGMDGNSLVAKHLSKFKPGALDHKEIADQFFVEDTIWYVADNLEKFDGGSVDHSVLAAELMRKGYAWVVADNLEKFDGGSVDQIQLAKQLIKSGNIDNLGDNLPKFKDVIDAIADLPKK